MKRAGSGVLPLTHPHRIIIRVEPVVPSHIPAALHAIVRHPGLYAHSDVLSPQGIRNAHSGARLRERPLIGIGSYADLRNWFSGDFSIAFLGPFWWSMYFPSSLKAWGCILSACFPERFFTFTPVFLIA